MKTHFWSILRHLEEGGHVGSAEMVYGLQSSEHWSPAQTLEVVLADVEHRGPDQWEVSIVSMDQSEASSWLTWGQTCGRTGWWRCASPTRWLHLFSQRPWKTIIILVYTCDWIVKLPGILTLLFREVYHNYNTSREEKWKIPTPFKYSLDIKIIDNWEIFSVFYLRTSMNHSKYLCEGQIQRK